MGDRTTNRIKEYIMNNKDLYKETIRLKKESSKFNSNMELNYISYKARNTVETILKDYNNLANNFCHELGQADIKDRRC